MNIPKGFYELKGVETVFVSENLNEIIIFGSPDPDDETHNCDYMRCPSTRCILFRGWMKSHQCKVEE